MKLVIGLLASVMMGVSWAETVKPVMFPLHVKVLTEQGELSLISKKFQPQERVLTGNPKAARLSERFTRKAVLDSKDTRGDLNAAIWRIKEANYTRYLLELTNTGKEPIHVKAFDLFKDWAPSIHEEGVGEKYFKGERVGNTDGAVAVFPEAGIFVGVENPLTKLTVKDGKVSAVLPREDKIQPGATWTVAWAVGSYPEKSQLRRVFQQYLNRERAHPYRVLPHYNSWYDINIGRNDAPWEKRMDEEEALGVMVHFRKELNDRGVFIDSYLWDDGWDNWDSLWDFHPGFPNGFRKLADEAHKNKGASIGAWLSPCGGYGGSHAARVRYAKSKGYIGPNDGLLRMSSPSYYAAFRDRVMMMIREYDMNIFKFDRMGVGHDCDGAPASHAADMEAIVRLIGEMRAAKQDVFINATVGTWASPYWVMFADSIWRGDQDFGRKGAGRARQQWVTYRDNQIHDRFVAKSPLFPLNSLMSHGIIVTRHGPPHVEDVSNTPASTQDFADEVWMSIASGTDLQEYYITPSLMHKEWWDILADGIKWLKANQQTLVDVHWVGGDPNTKDGAEVYGYASWTKHNWNAVPDKTGKRAKVKQLGKGIVILRNPSDKPQTFKTSFAKLFELPTKAKTGKIKSIRTVYSHDVMFEQPQKLAEEFTITFDPFGIVLLEVK